MGKKAGGRSIHQDEHQGQWFYKILNSQAETLNLHQYSRSTVHQ